MVVHKRLAAVFGLTLVAWVGLAVMAPGMGHCCPFCSQDQIPTLSGDYNQALLVLVGSFTNAKVADQSTDFVVEKVLKAHPFLKGDRVRTVDGKKVITVPKYLPQQKNKFVIFCDVFKGKIVPYRGIPVQPDSDMVRYLQGALAVVEREQCLPDATSKPAPGQARR